MSKTLASNSVASDQSPQTDYLYTQLEQAGHVLYVSAVDLSLPTGPSVNEREFVFGLCKILGSRAVAVVPTPKTSLREISQGNVFFYTPVKGQTQWTQLRNQLRLFRQAEHVLQTRTIDLIVVRLNTLPLAIYLLHKRYRIPYAIKTLGPTKLGIQLGLQPAWRFHKRLWRQLTNRLRRIVIEKALAVDACTSQITGQIVSDLPSMLGHTICVDNATNTERFRPLDRKEVREKLGLNEFDPIIGFVGGRPWERGGQQAIEIGAGLIADFPHVGIVVVGGGEGMKSLWKLAQELGVGNRCVFPGVVPYKEVVSYINAFDVGIVTDIPERIKKVGNSNQKVRQFMACGRPLVCSPGGNEFLEREGLGTLVEPGDETALDQAVRSWLSLSEVERHKFTRKAAAFARKHLSIERSIRQRLAFWDERLRE